MQRSTQDLPVGSDQAGDPGSESEKTPPDLIRSLLELKGPPPAERSDGAVAEIGGPRFSSGLAWKSGAACSTGEQYRCVTPSSAR